MTNSLSTPQAAPLQRHDVVDPVTENMVWIPGGTFVMGADHHYAEEAPAHPRGASFRGRMSSAMATSSRRPSMLPRLTATAWST